MSSSSTLRDLPEFVCEPPQVVPLPTPFSMLSPSTEPILCEPLDHTFAPLPPDPEQAEDVAAAHFVEVNPLCMRIHLLQPFSKSQLIDLLFSAASTRPDLLEDIRAVARRNPVHRKVFVYPLPPGTTPADLASAIRTRFGADSVEYALVSHDGRYGLVLFRRLADARHALSPPIGEGLPGAEDILFAPHEVWPPPSGRARRAVVARFAGPRSPQRLAEMGALLARYGAVVEGPAWVGSHVSSVDGSVSRKPSATYVVYEAAEAADAAVADNPKVVAGNLVFCERVVHITDLGPWAHQPPPPPPPPQSTTTTTERQEGLSQGQGTKRRHLDIDMNVSL